MCGGLRCCSVLLSLRGIGVTMNIILNFKGYLKNLMEEHGKDRGNIYLMKVEVAEEIFLSVQN